MHELSKIAERLKADLLAHVECSDPYEEVCPDDAAWSIIINQALLDAFNLAREHEQKSTIAALNSITLSVKSDTVA